MIATTVNTETPSDDRDLWRTPPDLFARLSAEYGPFDIDAAANADNHLCDIWFGPESPFDEDALQRSLAWGSDTPYRVFCNPPYSRGMVASFIGKAVEEARFGRARTTLLVPATVEQPWWHEWVWDSHRRRFRPGVEVEFLRSRVRYLRPDGTPAGSPNFASVVVTFGSI